MPDVEPINIENLFDNIPNAIEGVYSNGAFGSDIELFSGSIRLNRDATVVEGPGAVSLCWEPKPKIQFRLITQDNEITFDQLIEGNWEIELLDKWDGLSNSVHVMSAPQVNIGDGYSITGIIPICELATEISLRLASIQLANMPSFIGKAIKKGTISWKGRAEVTLDDWSLTIDQVNEDGLFKKLDDSTGFAITHNCEIKRPDGSTFTLEELVGFAELLRRALSFCCGRWVGPVLVAGYDAGANVISELWLCPKLSRYSVENNWHAFPTSVSLGSAIKGLLEKSKTKEWGDVIRHAVYWYVNASTSESVENSVVASQIVFELLGWMYLVEETKALSADGYKSLNASNKLRLLLTLLKISTEIPSELLKLNEFAKTKSNADGPEIVTEVRNAYIHPNADKLKYLDDLSTAGEEQVWLLSAHYLELILLALFNYEGKYVSRVATEPYAYSRLRWVPWGTPSDPPEPAAPLAPVANAQDGTDQAGETL